MTAPPEEPTGEQPGEPATGAPTGEPAGELVVLRTPDGVAPLDDVALGPALLARAQADPAAPAVLRLAWPRRTLAFSRLDTLAAGWPDAAEAARRHGFEPVVRQRGGRAAAYHEGCLLLDLVAADPDPRSGIRRRYTTGAAVLAAALGALGVDARVGPVPGEYCPGDFSVNAGGRLKLAGTAQRVVRGAWLWSAMLVVRDAASLRAVLTDVHDALALPWDPRTVGALDAVVPGVAGAVPAGPGRDVVERVVLDGWAALGHAVRPQPWPHDLVAEARAQQDRHRLP